MGAEHKPIVTAPTSFGSTEPRDVRERFSDVINVKDFGAKGDGITNDTVAFQALENKFSGRIVDLLGIKWIIDEIPTHNEYINGWFDIPVKTDAATVGRILVPTKDIYKQRLTQVSPSDGNYNAWPQDTAHSYNGSLYTFYNTDITHTSELQHPVLAISNNGGDSFDYAQHINPASSKSNSIFSAGVSPSGTQFAIITQSVRNEYSETNTCRLIGRRLPEFFNLSLSEGRIVEISVSAVGNHYLSFRLKDSSTGAAVEHGLLIGDIIEFSGTQTTVGGVALSGRFVVNSSSYLTSCTIVKENTDITTTSTETKTITTGYCSLNPNGKFHELFFNVNGSQKSFGVALNNFTQVNGNPTVVHSLCFANNAAYTWIHGNSYSNSRLVKISWVQLPTRSISFVRQFDNYAGVEGSIAYLGNNKFIGALRTESETYAMRFYIYDEANDTFTVNNTRYGKHHFERSPVPVRVINDYVIFAMSENRYTNVGDSTYTKKKELTVPIIIAYAKVSDILENISNFESKLTYEIIGNAYFIASRNDASAVGVPSLTSIGNELFVFYSSHGSRIISSKDGYPNTYCLRLDMSRLFNNTISKSAMEISGNHVISYGGFDRNYSALDWQNIPYYITLYFADQSVGGDAFTAGLRAEFMENAAKATLYFRSENVNSGEFYDFPIGHVYYDIEAFMYSLASDLQNTRNTIGIPVIDYANRTPKKFDVECRIASTTNTHQYGLGNVRVKVKLQRPINWLDDTYSE